MRDRAIAAVPYVPADLETWYAGIMSNYPDRHRYAADNMWTCASADELMPGSRMGRI
ncbi:MULTISPECIES: hypothetical protein [Mycolicibacterium]|uniref:FAD linked oxidase domain-containing protein n=2 Tax=Mycolicibacterium gilvum TaxID=1804 RepID=A0A378SFP3_9MYCO|nr:MULTISPECIES: hypothetical protein [Mycolicibacterium]ABP43005.1 FAD linked oxidase domain protein [Mycolicibacterium gilvum PYR-GCK]MBV5246792.1 hypothetical protein [Mycolicibacterium sp. PAM1]MCV7055942.1 hypothetical protein [Mycolicibacterium gilvum]STZ40958.1 FAD linked oxidase domain-containing protein [Mycolicibacterium gilvum]